MGAGQSDLYQGTYGDDPDNIPEALKGTVKLPENDAQLKHIFRDARGQLKDTPENRRLLQELANDVHHHVGRDAHGNDWHFRELEDGSQLWTSSRNGIIQEGGLNNPPRPWNERTGLNNDPFGDDMGLGGGKDDLWGGDDDLFGGNDE